VLGWAEVQWHLSMCQLQLANVSRHPKLLRGLCAHADISVPRCPAHVGMRVKAVLEAHDLEQRVTANLLQTPAEVGQGIKDDALPHEIAQLWHVSVVEEEHLVQAAVQVFEPRSAHAILQLGPLHLAPLDQGRLHLFRDGPLRCTSRRTDKEPVQESKTLIHAVAATSRHRKPTTTGCRPCGRTGHRKRAIALERKLLHLLRENRLCSVYAGRRRGLSVVGCWPWFARCASRKKFRLVHTNKA